VSRRSVLLLLAVAGGVTVAAAAQAWVRLAVRSDLAPLDVTVTGAALVPLTSAAGVVALAGSLAALTARGWGRRVVGTLVVLVASVALVQTLTTLTALVERARRWWSVEVGADAAGAATAGTTAWPVVTGIALVAVVVAGALVIAYAGRWAGLSGRYEARPAAVRDDPWVALDRGDDPTADPDGP
jgi:uncharacterized membrane protein (TIGR02234 family)